MKKTVIDFAALMITAAGLGTAFRTAENEQWGVFMVATLVAVVAAAILVLRGVERKLAKPIEE